MEFEGQPRLYGACNLLGVPGPSSLDVDSDEGEEVIGIRPKSSPQPRRRSSVTDEDSEPEPPLSGSRRVSFADTKGLSLVQVKEFDTWDVPKLPGYDSCEGDNNETEEYYISTLTFTRPLPNGELLAKVWDQKVELETVELLPGTTTLKGVIRVLNISLTKAVYIRTTFDAWSNYFDLLAEYTHGSSDDLMDYFSFKITLVPPFGEQGARVDFCVRYETPAGTFWANNNCENYVLFCHQKRIKDVLKKDNVNKKSCLKTISQNYSFEETISAEEVPSQKNNPTVKLNLEEEENTTGAKNTNDSQSETSLKGGTKLVGESRRFSSQRSARKAARMARVRDHFAQRNSDAERDESTPEAKQAEKQVNVEGVTSYSEDSSMSELLNSLQSPADVLHSVLHASHDTTHKQPENSTQVDLSSLEMDTNISDNLIHLNTEAEEKTVRQDPQDDVRNNAAAEPVDGAISTGINESLPGQTNNTFGTVVAPLYNEMLGKVGSESQRFSDWKDHFKTSKSAPDLTQSHFIPERKESCSNYSNGRNKKVINSQTCSSWPFKEEERKQRNESLMAENIMDPEVGNKQPNQKGKNTTEDPIPLSVKGESQIPSEELHNDSLPLPSPTETDENNAVTQLSPKAMATVTTQFSLCQQNDITSESNQETGSVKHHESKEDADTCENKTKSNTNASPGVDTHSERLYDLNTKQIETSAAKAKDFPSPVTREDAQNKNIVQERIRVNEDEIQCQDMSEVSKQACLIANTKGACDSHMIGKMDEEEESLIHEARLEMSVQEDLVLENTACVKNWETMVKEEEETVITDCEKSDLMRYEIGPTEQMEDAAAEEKNPTQQENKKTAKGPEKATAAEVKDSSAEVAVVLKYKERVRKKAFRTINPATQEAEKEEEYVQVEKTEKVRVKEQVDEIESVEKKSEQNKEQTLAEQSEMQDVVVRGNSFQEMEATGMENKVELHLNNGYTCPGLTEEQEKHVEKTEEDQNYINGFNFNKVKTETIDSESNWRRTEEAVKVEEHFKERLDLTPNMVEDVSPAQVTSMEDTSFEEGHEVDEPAHIPPEILLHKEADILNNRSVTSNRSQDQVVSCAAEPQSCSLPEEPESDQASYGSESAESDSDDEVELYMHCLRAVHAGSRATKDKGTNHSYGKRGSISRNKQLPAPMPSIKESLDEEPQQNYLQDNTENTNATEIQHDGLESDHKPVSWWSETFSWSSISKSLLFSTLLFVFVVVAYHYDFLACFGLYLISLVWLCCQKETPSMKKR